MYLHNEVLEGKPPMTKNFVLPNQSYSWRQRPEVLKLRKLLLILLGLVIAFTCLWFISSCIGLAVNHSNKGQSATKIWSLISPLISLAFYALGFYSTYRCHRDALLVFAWVSVVSLVIGIFGGIILIILSAAVIGANTTAMFEGKGAALGIVVIVLLAVAVGSLLFQIFIIRCGFALAKLLKVSKISTHTRV